MISKERYKLIDIITLIDISIVDFDNYTLHIDLVTSIYIVFSLLFDIFKSMSVVFW